MDSLINQVGERPVTPIDQSIRAVGSGQRQQPATDGIGALGEIPVAVASENHISPRAENEEQEVNCLSSFCDHVTLAATEAGTVAHTLWNSIPPFMTAGDKQHYTDVRATWVGHRTNPYFVELGLTPQVDAVIAACDAIIALPSYGYHLTAQQRYEEFQAATANFRTAEQTALTAEQAALTAEQAARNAALDAVDETATVLTPIPGSKERAYHAVDLFGIGQAHDARQGRAGRIPEPAQAIPIADEISDDATVHPSLPHAEAEDATPMDPEYGNTDLSPVARAEAHVENPVHISSEDLS